jgi:hypothetical protein
MRQEKGIRLVEPKEHMAKSYMEEADKTFDNFLKATGKWKVIWRITHATARFIPS